MLALLPLGLAEIKPDSEMRAMRSAMRRRVLRRRNWIVDFEP
jgi:hypothetical protein